MTSFGLFSLKQTNKNKRCFNIKKWKVKCGYYLSELGLKVNVSLCYLLIRRCGAQTLSWF